MSVVEQRRILEKVHLRPEIQPQAHKGQKMETNVDGRVEFQISTDGHVIEEATMQTPGRWLRA